MAEKYSEVLVKVGPTLRKPDGGAILVLDGSMAQSHTISAKVSEHPVEGGADIADHVQPTSPRLSINGVIAAYPLSGGGAPGREIDGWTVLRQVIDDAQPVTVVTSLETYDNMVLVSLSVAREPGGASCIYPTLELQQIRVVQRRTTLLPPEQVKKKSQKPKAPAATDVGRQPTAAPTEAQDAAVRRSVFKTLTDSLTGGG